jgi:hypothetical protein
MEWGITDEGKADEGKADGRIPSMMTSVKKYRRTSNHTPTEFFRW